MFNSILDTAINQKSFFICLAAAVVIGLLTGIVYALTNKKHTSGFIITLAILPSVVSMVILLVNGNLGAGVAVGGAFSLLRFRSVPGKAKEIVAIFISLTAGVSIGMGYVGVAAIFTVVMLVLLGVYSALGIGDKTKGKKILTVVLPENLNYDSVFDGILKKYTTEYELVAVKTTNMGSLFKLTYEITMKDNSKQKAMIDEIRVRNGNLEISCNRYIEGEAQL